MKKYSKRYTSLLFFSLFFFSFSSSAKTAMTEDELKAETGKGFSASIDPTGTINLALDGQTRSGLPISVTGTVDVVQKTGDINQPRISLSDSAQQGMQSFVITNAVDSTVQTLINLVVNIDSTVGTIEQANQALHNQEFFQ